IERHLDNCDECRGLYFEMADVGLSLRAALVPLVLGGPAALAAVKAISGAGAGVVSAGAGVASIASISAGGAGVAAAGTGAAAAGTSAAVVGTSVVGTGTVVTGVAAATVAATVGGALVLPSVTTIASDPAPAVAEAHGRTTAGLTEPVVIPAPPKARSAAVPAQSAAPAEAVETAGSETEGIEPETATEPETTVLVVPVPTTVREEDNDESGPPGTDPSSGQGVVSDGPGGTDESGVVDAPDEGQLGDDLLVGDIGVPLVIAPPVPTNPLDPNASDVIQLEDEPVVVLPQLAGDEGVEGPVSPGAEALETTVPGDEAGIEPVDDTAVTDPDPTVGDEPSGDDVDEDENAVEDGEASLSDDDLEDSGKSDWVPGIVSKGSATMGRLPVDGDAVGDLLDTASGLIG
ncbi:MAG: hypothetical protein P8N02_10310, partial [Actinomycetota bacterium]|nr:hypothetical protein [Actinomycetota bacterium]